MCVSECMCVSFNLFTSVNSKVSNFIFEELSL